MVYDARGDIVTNAHVVGAATTLQVGLPSGGKPLTAEVIGRHASRSGLQGPGSVRHALLNHAHGPIAIVPSS